MLPKESTQVFSRVFFLSRDTVRFRLDIWHHQICCLEANSLRDHPYAHLQVSNTVKTSHLISNLDIYSKH